jgi:hypothetical protein
LIQRSTTATAGQDVPARDGNRPKHASLSEYSGIPIPYSDTKMKIAQELRKSPNPINSATQNSGLEQALFLDLPADPPQLHEIHKRVLGEFTDDSPNGNERYDSEFPLTSNGNQAEIHSRDGDRQNESESGRRRCKNGRRRGGTSRKKIVHKGGRNKCKDEVIPRKRVLVVDKLNPERFKIIEIPITEDVDDFNLSDEAIEALGDKISSSIDITKIKQIKGDEAQKRLQESKKENEEKDENEGENEDVLEENYN